MKFYIRTVRVACGSITCVCSTIPIPINIVPYKHLYRIHDHSVPSSVPSKELSIAARTSPGAF